jgi:hypothetical protein
VLRSFFDEIVVDGYLTRDGDSLHLTASGRAQVDLMTAAWRAWLVRELQEWLPAAGSGLEPGDTQIQRVNAALDRMVVRLVRESELEAAPA